jgi:hypothetical protein
MSRGLQLSVACLAAAWAAMIPNMLRAQESKDLKIFASLDNLAGPIRLKKEDSGVVIRNSQELVAHSSKPGSAKDPAVQKKMESELAKLLKVDGIDWTKQMILAVNGHQAGYALIKFDSLKIEGKILTVTWKQEERPALGISVPSGLVLVERFEGEVKFVPFAKKKG